MSNDSNLRTTMFEKASHLWVLHISNHEETARRAQLEGFVCIGWTKMGDLSKLPTRDAVKAAMRRAYPNWGVATINSAHGQPFRFAHEMKVRDPLVYPVKGSREIMI